MSFTSHQHVSARAVRAQLLYSESEAALSTSREIIERKLRNCYFLLSAYRQSRSRVSSPHETFIAQAQLRIKRASDKLREAKDKSSLFRIEAEAARSYWGAVGLICHDPQWRRVYPHARDHLNILLNSGYVALARKLVLIISSARLLPEIGILHGDSSGESLAYDIMECFRQPAVDATIIPLFARKRTFPAILHKKDIQRGFSNLTRQMKKRFPYKGRCERLERITELEVLKLKKCILAHCVWRPYTQRWGHSWRCEQK